MKAKLTSILFLILVIGCNNETIDQDYVYPSIPLSEGNWWVYQVQEKYYFNNEGNAEYTDYLKKFEVIEKQVTTGDFDRYLISIKTSVDDGISWNIDGYFSLEKNGNSILLNQSNLVQLMMEAPIYQNRKWNTNKYNSLNSQFTSVDSLVTSSSNPSQYLIYLTLEDNRDNLLDSSLKTMVFIEGEGISEYYYYTLESSIFNSIHYQLTDLLIN